MTLTLVREAEEPRRRGEKAPATTSIRLWTAIGATFQTPSS